MLCHFIIRIFVATHCMLAPQPLNGKVWPLALPRQLTNKRFCGSVERRAFFASVTGKTANEPAQEECAATGKKLDRKLELKERHWDCPQCGQSHDRDVNAARNVLAAGLAVSAHGESVSPVSL